jgi:hypothetical protein
MAGSSSEDKEAQAPEKKQITLLPEDKEKFGLLVNQFKEADDLGEAAELLEQVDAFLKDAIKNIEAEDERQMEIVEFRGNNIHRYEKEALFQLRDAINAGIAKRRASEPKFNASDINTCMN